MEINLNNQSIILASKSPRRDFLLKQAGLNFSIIPSSFDESSIKESDPKKYVKILAKEKANDIAEQYPESWVIGADTIVFINEMILEKPESKSDALRMLKMLSNNVHTVVTGYVIVCKSQNKCIEDISVSDVYFKDLSDKEINWYINTEEPFDKAGAYAIQGLGSFFISYIKGSYTNIVGLPVCEVMQVLINEKIVDFN